MILCKDNITKLTMPEKKKRGREKENGPRMNWRISRATKKKQCPRKMDEGVRKECGYLDS